MSVELGFTIQGRGGQTVCWLDNTGAAPWSALANYNFVLLPNATDNWQATTSGSFLLSTPFALTSAQKLTVIASVITAHSLPFFDVGFALLVKGSQVQKVLFALRPDGVTRRGDTGPNPPNSFAPPSAGVTVTPAVQQGVPNVALGGVVYGPPTNPGDGNVFTNVTAVCTPGAGQYQVLFGMFVTDNAVNITRPAALIAHFVDVR